MIDSGTDFYFTRAFARAEAASADAIIIDMDTPGGELGATMQIRNRIFESDIPTYTYIRHWAISAGALIALSTDGIYMGPSSSIGGAQPIAGSGAEIPEAVDEKITSIMRSEIRSTLREQARENPDRWDDEALDYLIRISEAFITPPDEDIMSLHVSGEVVCSAGELLTMDWEEAIQEGLADGRCEDLDEVLAAIGLADAELREIQLTWSEQLARFFSRSMISGALLLIGLAAAYIEFKTPGIGLGLAVAIIAFSLFFFGTHLADLSNFFDVLLVAIGIGLIAVEVFILPGFGFAGVAGFACLLTGLIMALVRLPPPEFDFRPLYITDALNLVALSLVLSIAAIIALASWLPKTRLWNAFDLEPATIGPLTPALPVGGGISRTQDLMGLAGTAQTDLRPSGKVDIDGHPFNVVSDGDFISKGARVKVTAVEGSRVVVALIED
jgi:membrane-bound serine protease (ClpP class)